ncbi:cupin domain-containing protein [Saccharopolyspora cebuensis]|uniref:Cupin domain-containing protein n=1 Tax=Saccharopolyspora cebuensis TaxID=418759 RepID=A0ABV4CHK7_9PSEU
MTTQRQQTVEHRGFDAPDEIREFDHGRAEVLNMADGAIGRLVLHPGWQWSRDVKPLVGTEWCEAPHFQYHVSGKLRVRMADGDEFDVGPGSISSLPQGHDAWVVGDEDVVLVDWYGATDYAKRT